MNNNHQNLLFAYEVAGTVLYKNAMSSHYCAPRFTGEKTEA